MMKLKRNVFSSRISTIFVSLLFLFSFVAPAGAGKPDQPLPPFEGQQDVGTVLHPVR